jgi:hypothetical protein
MSYAIIVAAATRLYASGLTPPAAPGPLALPPESRGAMVETRQVVVFERPPLTSLATSRDHQAAVNRPSASV